MQFLREEQAHISSAWGGRVASLQADDVPIEYFIPEEGAVTHSEGYAIPEASENKETVYDLLDWVYQREKLVDLSVQIDYPVPISDPPEEITSLPDYTDHPDNLVWINWSEVLPHNDKISQAFNEVRGS
jgi:spermidine/putrescine transport system substrate-binding protein